MKRRRPDRLAVIRNECSELQRFRAKWEGRTPPRDTPEYQEYIRDGKRAHDALERAISFDCD